MSEKTSTASATASVGFPVASLAVFVMLIMKLGNIAGFASVSWWWVFSPWLIAIGLTVGILLVIAVVGGIILGGATALDKRDAKKAEKARAARNNTRA